MTADERQANLASLGARLAADADEAARRDAEQAEATAWYATHRDAA